MMARIVVDNVEYQVDGRQNLLQACLSQGIDIPYFCWHPALGSVGACRQCAVKQFKDDNDGKGRIVMACMTPARDGARISVADPEATAFRAEVIEWLMVNHPHDCPVCEEGGECHLQDMTLMTGHVYRRYRFDKRTFRNQYLGPFLNHEMNRCIACYRCVRFYNDYAGGHDLTVLAAHNHVYFGRHTDGALENPFSGNLAEVCPTGVFTDRTHSEHYVRKWDQQGAPSVCVHCGHGCNTLPGERQGLLRRITNRYNSSVNGYFLCDRGRFGYGFVNSDRRIRWAYRRPDKGVELAPVGREEATRLFAGMLFGKQKAVGIGSPRASLESNFALREAVGADSFYSGIPEPQFSLVRKVVGLLRVNGGSIRDLPEVERSDAVIVLGEDVMNTAPRLGLALRQSVRQRAFAVADHLGIPDWQDVSVRGAGWAQKSPLFVGAPHSTGLDDVATETFRAAPVELARLGYTVAGAIDPAAAKGRPAKKLKEQAQRVAEALLGAQRPLVVAGTSLGSEAVIDAAMAIVGALRNRAREPGLSLVVPDCNSVGLALMTEQPLDAAFRLVKEGGAKTVVVLENDLFRNAAPKAVQRFRSKIRNLVALDHLAHETASMADLVLPAGTFAESDGTLVSAEGRAQRFFQVLTSDSDIVESWRWLGDAMRAAGLGEARHRQTLDELTAACASAIPELASIVEAAPPAGFRNLGQKVPRQLRRYSGRTAMTADASVHEPMPPEDPDSPLAFSMEGNGQGVPPSLLTQFWAPRWNSCQAVNKFQEEIAGPLRGGDPGVRLFGGEPDGAGWRQPSLPRPFRREKSRLLAVPLWHVFGSEELSRASRAVASRSPGAYIAVNPADAGEVAQGEMVTVSVTRRLVDLPVRFDETLPSGVVGIPVGLEGTPWLALPAWVELRRRSA